MGRYAAETSVAVEKSKAEIEATLARYGATGFLSGWSHNQAVIGFVIEGRQVKFTLSLPDQNDEQFTHHARGRRTADSAHRSWEQACRQRWRALCLCIKAKLAAAEAGITTLEDEFMAHIVLPDGQTVGQFMCPQIESAYQRGAIPKLLPGPDRNGAGAQ